MKRVFARLYRKDKRDLLYLMKPNMKKAATITSRYWYTGPPLDQGSTPQCVAYAGFKWLTSSPVRNFPKFTPAYLYKQAQENDEWPGTNYDGTSIRGLFKWLNKAAYSPRYEWAFQADVVAAYILTVGPLVLGTDWYSGMMEPDSKGLIHVKGYSEGGHGYVACGCNNKSKLIRIINSWGDWGENGRAWMTFDDLQKLLDARGEACVATEVKI